MPIIDDNVEDSGEKFKFNVDHVCEAVIWVGEATGTILNSEETTEPLTASFHDAPAAHNGSDSFTFELKFSENVKMGFKKMEDHVLTVTGGEVDSASRITKGSNQRRTIHVDPSGNDDVVITLPITTDCSAQRAVCTTGGKQLSAQVSLTVPGPEDEDSQEQQSSDGTDDENNSATGAPTISGTAQVGQTLTASTSGINDADGLNNVSYSYQWIRSDGTTDSDIAGATSSTYELVDADQGKTIKVKVSFTDDQSNSESLTSAPTGTVAARPNNAATGPPTISGTAQVGQTLTASTSGIVDSDGLNNVSYSYQWIRSDGTTDSDIVEATNSTYELVDADQGKTIKVKVSFTDNRNHSESLTSAATGNVAAAPQTLQQQPPPKPTNLTVTANSNGTITLSWNAPADDSVTGYQILRRKPFRGETTLMVYVEDTNSTATSYVDTDVELGTRHTYRVKAINSAGVGPRSNYSYARPQ